jgi:hypothetical protein
MGARISAVLRIVEVVDRRLYAILDGKNFEVTCMSFMDGECGPHERRKESAPGSHLGRGPVSLTNCV